MSTIRVAQAGREYTMIRSNNGLRVEFGGAANTLTIPANACAAFPVGTVITVGQKGAGNTIFLCNEMPESTSPQTERPERAFAFTPSIFTNAKPRSIP